MISYESTTSLLHQDLQVCTLIQDLLPLYVEGEVSANSREAIVQHLSQCERCAAFLAGAQSVRTQLRREHSDVARVLAGDQPAQQSMQTYQQLAKVAMLVVLIPVGLIIAGELWGALPWTARQVAAIGPMTAFGALVLAFARRGKLSITNIITLGTASFAGILGILTLVGGDVQAPYFFAATALIVGSLAAIWSVAGRTSTS
jgi:predicted anti-sigma-YlaC factor YlaD